MLEVKEVLDRALSAPGAIVAALPADHASFQPLYSSPDLTIMHFVWGRSMELAPHDHRMSAVIGVYTGDEDNVFYRRDASTIVTSGGKHVATGESAMLGSETIHAVSNPSSKLCTGAIHIYGGDFLHKQRSIWDASTLKEGPADGETIRQIFEEARARDEWQC
jgi:predicted metal-dependent enzyme (double-stranded beta helix superfamily)